MDRCAEFTLRVAAIAQGVLPGAHTPTRWFLMPVLKPVSWDEAREFLAEQPKPLFVSPLTEPGHLLVLPSAGLGPAMAHHLTNQVSFYDEKIPRLGLADGDALILGTAEGDFAFDIGEFKRWLREYQLLAKVALALTTEPGVAQILVFGPEQGKPPLNPYRRQPPPRAGECGHDHSHG
jgi:hypothetical protein